MRGLPREAWLHQQLEAPPRGTSPSRPSVVGPPQGRKKEVADAGGGGRAVSCRRRGSAAAVAAVEGNAPVTGLRAQTSARCQQTHAGLRYRRSSADGGAARPGARCAR